MSQTKQLEQQQQKLRCDADPDDGLLQLCQREIEELHSLFVAWFQGNQPLSLLKNELHSRLQPQFSHVAPNGQFLSGRDVLLSHLLDKYGCYRDRVFRIDIYNVQLLWGDEIHGRCLCTYEEWQSWNQEEKTEDNSISNANESHSNENGQHTENDGGTDDKHSSHDAKLLQFGRLSTCLLERKNNQDCGEAGVREIGERWTWVHVHETWLESDRPSATGQPSVVPVTTTREDDDVGWTGPIEAHRKTPHATVSRSPQVAMTTSPPAMTLSEIKESEARLIVLMSSHSLNREQTANQLDAFAILEASGLFYETVDGVDFFQRNVREELFDVSGIRGSYPQFFLGSREKVTYWGDYRTLKMSYDKGTIAEDVGLQVRESNTFFADDESKDMAYHSVAIPTTAHMLAISDEENLKATDLMAAMTVREALDTPALSTDVDPHNRSTDKDPPDLHIIDKNHPDRSTDEDPPDPSTEEYTPALSTGEYIPALSAEEDLPALSTDEHPLTPFHSAADDVEAANLLAKKAADRKAPPTPAPPLQEQHPATLQSLDLEATAPTPPLSPQAEVADSTRGAIPPVYAVARSTEHRNTDYRRTFEKEDESNSALKQPVRSIDPPLETSTTVSYNLGKDLTDESVDKSSSSSLTNTSGASRSYNSRKGEDSIDERSIASSQKPSPPALTPKNNVVLQSRSIKEVPSRVVNESKAANINDGDQSNFETQPKKDESSSSDDTLLNLVGNSPIPHDISAKRHVSPKLTRYAKPLVWESALVGLHISGFDIGSSQGPIGDETWYAEAGATLEELSQIRDAPLPRRKICLPEMVFPTAHVALEGHGFWISWDAVDALEEWARAHNQISIDSRTTHNGVSVLRSKDALLWEAKRKHRSSKDTSNANANSVFHYDWTFSTPFSGKVEGGAWQELDKSGMRMDLLTDQSVPIIFFDEVVLFEDDLHDNGQVSLIVKIRVMPSCTYILSRLFCRVDEVMIRSRETRVMVDFLNAASNKPTVYRDVNWRECLWNQLSVEGLPSNVKDWRCDVETPAFNALLKQLPEVTIPESIAKHAVLVATGN